MIRSEAGHVVFPMTATLYYEVSPVPAMYFRSTYNQRERRSGSKLGELATA
jgi:hypothetical protein